MVNEKYGDSGSVGHADTTILLHVSKDRTNATAMSIPRDMIVDIPECPTTQEDGSTKDIQGSTDVRFNTSLGQSGRTPSCTVRTVTQLTGIKPDHFMVADFNAVKTLSTAVGGVKEFTITDADNEFVATVNWQAPALNTVLLRFSEDEVRNILVYGRPGTPMPAWGLPFRSKPTPAP